VRGFGVGRVGLVACVVLAATTLVGGRATAATPTPTAPAAPDDGVSAQVVGGNPIGPDDYPSMAAILIAERGTPARDRLICSGTVIGPRWVLTAGHCSEAAFFGPPLLVQAGSRDLGDPHATVVHVNRIVVHHVFFEHGNGFDVSLFHVSPSLPTTPSRLAGPADAGRAAGGANATIAGWGLTKRLGIAEPPDFRAHPPVRARAVDVPVIDDAACVATYKDFATGFVVPASDICAGDEGHDACYGDSGGPLYSADGNGPPVQIGITSRGAGCATKLFPGVFTDVRRVHGWIHHWTTHPCRTSIETLEPGFPGDILGVPLFVC
jgi:trypsin